jgi:hypothetical protein
MKHWLQSALRRTLSCVVAGLLAAAAVALALLALHSYAAAVLDPTFGALVTDGGALVLAGFVLLGDYFCQRAARKTPQQPSNPDPEDARNIALGFLKRNPKQASAAAAAAGVILGLSPKLRRSLIRLLNEYR